MRRLPPLRLLNVFETVVRTGGVQQAARELNVSQPAISQALRQLEAHIGVTLLDRRTRPARLTASGAILHQASLENTNRLVSALDEIAAQDMDSANTVTIACTIGLATFWLMPRLVTFHERHPDILVNVVTTPRTLPDLAPGTDIALRFGDGEWQDGHVRELFRERVGPVCAPGILHRVKSSKDENRSVTIINVQSDDPRWIGWPEYWNAVGADPFRFIKEMNFTNYVQAAQAAVNGGGVMLGWRSITDDHVAAGQLVPIGTPLFDPKESYFAIIAYARQQSDAVQAMTQWLLETSRTMRSGEPAR